MLINNVVISKVATSIFIMLSVIVPSVVAPSKSSVILKLTLMPRNVIELDAKTN